MRDVVLTSATTAVSTVALLLAIRVVARTMGAQQFGVYSIARQLFAWLTPFSTLAMGTAVARYTAVATSPRQQVSYLLNGTLLATGSAGMLALLGVVGGTSFASLLFQDERYATVLMATLLLVLGYGFYAVLYGYYRGSGRIGRANLLQLLLAAVGPLVVAGTTAKSGRMDVLLLLTGASYALAAVGIFLENLGAGVDVNAPSAGAHSSAHACAELFWYGIPRVPGGLALSGMLAVGPFLAPRIASLREAGFLSASQSVFALAEAGVASFGFVALPRAAQLVVGAQHDYLRRRISDIVVFALHVGLFVTVQLTIWAEPLVIAWLGPEYRDAVGLMRVLLVALVPYLIYVMLRSIIDAVEPRAINSRNLYIALGVTIAACSLLSLGGLRQFGLAAGTALGFITLGCLTTGYLFTHRWIQLPDLHAVLVMKLNATAALIAVAVLGLLRGRVDAGSELAVTFVLEGILFVSYTYRLRKAGVCWVSELEHRVFQTRRR